MRNIGSLPRHLPRVDVIIEPEISCYSCCQGALHRIGEDVSEMLDIVPAILRVKRIHRPRYGCRACESAVVQAAAAPRPVEGGLPTAAFLAHIVPSKFAWQGLTVFLADGRVEVDNNTVERAIRPIPLGRENALFAGSRVASAADAAADR